MTSSTVADDGGEEEAGKVIFILKSGNTSARSRHGNHSVISEQAKEENTQRKITENVLEKELESQDSRKENLLRHLIIGGSNSRISTDEFETLNELLPEKMLSNEAH